MDVIYNLFKRLSRLKKIASFLAKTEVCVVKLAMTKYYSVNIDITVIKRENLRPSSKVQKKSIRTAFKEVIKAM